LRSPQPLVLAFAPRNVGLKVSVNWVQSQPKPTESARLFLLISLALRILLILKSDGVFGNHNLPGSIPLFNIRFARMIRFSPPLRFTFEGALQSSRGG